MLSLTSPRHTSNSTDSGRLFDADNGSSSALAAGFARDAGPVGSRDWPRNSGRRSAFATSDRFTYDCLWRVEAQSKKGKSACGIYLPDLEHPRPPDAPPGMVKLRLVKKR